MLYLYDTIQTVFLANFFTDCQNNFDNDKYEFLSILKETIHLNEIIPVSFISHFHAATGRPHRHLLFPMLRALLLQLIFSIPTTSLLIVFLKYSQKSRDFCRFGVVPDTSKFTRFKQDFLSDLQSMFDHLVDLTEPICLWIDRQKPSICGRMFYIYPEKNLRAYTGTNRGTDEWDSTYKIKVSVEKSINHFKDSFYVAGRKARNEKTLDDDLLLSGITQFITVLVTDKIHKHRLKTLDHITLHATYRLTGRC